MSTSYPRKQYLIKIFNFNAKQVGSKSPFTEAISLLYTTITRQRIHRLFYVKNRQQCYLTNQSSCCVFIQSGAKPKTNHALANVRRYPALGIRELKQRRRQRQRERHKTIGLISKNNRSARALYVFVHFFAVLCKTTT